MDNIEPLIAGVHPSVIEAQVMIHDLLDEDLKDLANSPYLNPGTVVFIQLLRNSKK